MIETHVYLRRGGLALLAIGFAGFVADYVMNIGLSRMLSTHDYGDFKVGWTYSILFGSAVLLGGDRACPRALAGPLARGEFGFAWEYLRFYIIIGLGLSAVVIALTWLLSFLQVGHEGLRNHHAVAWLAVSVPLLAVGAMMSRSVQSAQHPARAAFLWRVALPVLFLIVLAVMAWLMSVVALADVLAAAILVAAAATAWQWYDARRVALPELRRDRAAFRPREWLSISLPMTGFFLVAVALSQSDIFFLEVLGDEHEVGLYAAAFTTAHFLVLIQTTVLGLMAPLVSLALEADQEAQARTARQGRLIMLAGIIPASVLILLAAEPILSLFGNHYQEAATVLRFLVAGNFAWAAVALTALWLQYTERGKSVLAISLITLGVDSACNVILIPRFGMLGAAASTAFTLALAGIALVVVRSWGSRWQSKPAGSEPAPRLGDL